MKREGWLGFIPILMSFTACGILSGYLALYGFAKQPDEGAAAHLWQILMAGQIPLIVWFLVRSYPRDRRRTLRVFGMQMIAVLAALAPVWYLSL